VYRLIFCRWAAVKVTLLIVTEAVSKLASFLGEQPVNDMTAATVDATTARLRGHLTWHSVIGIPQNDLFLMFIIG